MSLSANEIQALATKAARGAGFPPGQAESYGRATVMHLVAGRDPQPLHDALAQVDNSPILRLPLLVDDILAACAAVKGPAELTLNPDDSALEGVLEGDTDEDEWTEIGEGLVQRAELLERIATAVERG